MHRSFIQGNLQSVTISTLTVEEEEGEATQFAHLSLNYQFDISLRTFFLNFAGIKFCYLLKWFFNGTLRTNAHHSINI